MRTKLAGFLLLILVGTVMSQSTMPDVEQRLVYQFTPPGAMGVGLYGYDNPSLLTYLHQPDILFTWSDKNDTLAGLNDWGLFLALPRLGFGMITHNNGEHRITDYRISSGFGSRSVGLGIGYGWPGGAKDVDGPPILTIGSLFRPSPRLSFGLTGVFALDGKDREALIDLALRPLGNEKITFFGDYPIKKGVELKEANWSAGAVFEFIPGIRLTGRYFSDQGINLGLNFSLGRIGTHTQAHFDKDLKHIYNTYGIRLGAYDRNIFSDMLLRKKNYVELNLLGSLKYQRFAMFDKSLTLKDMICHIDAAKNDKTVAGIAINTSGMMINVEMIWELREKLKDFKTTGKMVVIYIDNVGTFEYYLASVADKVVIDPLGIIDLRGLVMGRTFMRGTLEKLGVGFEEWRFFKYKSAAEVFSRDKMSEADREQRQELINDIYGLIKTEVCKSRNFTPEEFDRLVNEAELFIAKQSLENRLADTIGHWEIVKDIIRNIEGKSKNFINPAQLSKYQLPYDNYWGKKPKIAIVYALGECAMDQGIKARSLVRDIESVIGNKSIKAVVFRVDSPGGDALASDIVAEALKKCKEKKPVIVSQGLVAGSGGYWLSMYGDTIVASPITITGSIGVIGGWIYNVSLKEKLGLSTDRVQVGKHADLDFGAVLPLLGISIPDRNLTEEEFSRMEELIKSLYHDFVERISSGRNKGYDEIEAVAQGRVWTGMDGQEKGLVDVIGGLETAIKIAKEKAGIPIDREITIVELPKPGLFDLAMFSPKLINVDTKFNYLRYYLQNNGRPMLLLPLDYLEMISYLEQGD